LLGFSLRDRFEGRCVMAETSAIPILYETYEDGSQGERTYLGEIKAWLPSQPQGTWLMVLKKHELGLDGLADAVHDRRSGLRYRDRGLYFLGLRSGLARRQRGDILGGRCAHRPHRGKCRPRLLPTQRARAQSIRGAAQRACLCGGGPRSAL